MNKREDSSVLTVMSQNVQYGAAVDGRWGGIVEIFRATDPQIVLLQEVDFLTDPEKAAAAEDALGMRLEVAPSRNLNTAVAWDPEHLELLGVETKLSVSEMHHGYCAARFRPWAWSVSCRCRWSRSVLTSPRTRRKSPPKRHN